MRYLIAMILATLVTAGARGQTTLVAWEVTGQTNYGIDGLTASVVATGITNSTGLTRGSGVTTSGTAAANAWGGTRWNYATAAEAVAANVYVTFGLTVNTSYSTSLSRINLNYRRSATGPPNGAWDYQLNGGTWTSIGDFASQFSSVSTDGSSITPIDLSGLMDLQDLPAGTIVNFRIIPYGASDPSTGKWYVYGPITGYDLTVSGTLVDVSLAVAMRKMRATSEGGRVYVDFSTATELDLAGFNVSRACVKDGPFEIISSYTSNVSLRAAGGAQNGGSYSYVDHRVSSGKTYYYKVDAVDGSGRIEQMGEILAVTVTVPKEFVLYQNYPNPFNPATTVRYDLQEPSRVIIRVFDPLGRVVRDVILERDAGSFETDIDMTGMPSGVYYYMMSAVGRSGSSYVDTKKMVLMK